MAKTLGGGMSKPKAAGTTGAKRTASAHAEPKSATATPAMPKLSALQLAAIVKPFWVEVLSNNIKNAKKILVEFGHKLDFNAVRYTPNADGTGLHLCAQYGFVAMAQMLLDFKLDMNVPNKVGSTPLHVACKFQQTTMVTFLLDKGAYVDLPDHQSRVAFDVAPYAVLDLCMLKPLRDSQAELEECQAQLQSENQEAQDQFDAAVLRFMQQSMVFSDFESRTWDERVKVSAMRVIENEWGLKVQDAKYTLDAKQALCVAHQQVLVDLDDERAAAALGVRKQAELEQRDAIERLQDAQMALQDTTNKLTHAQDMLDMECGLIDAATEYPHDPAVQSWVLDTVSLMFEEHDRNDADAEAELQQLLMRTEIVQVVLNVFGRFDSARHLQIQALHCLVQLLNFYKGTGTDGGGSRAIAMGLAHFNMITVVGDVMIRFENDSTITSIGLQALYQLFRVANSTRQVMQFCQRKANQMLPINVLALDGASSSMHCHAAFILFTMTKYNVRQGLLQHGIVKLILQFFGSISSRKAETVQYLVASLALLHTIPSHGLARGKSYDGSLDAEPAWATFHLSIFIEAIQSLVQPKEEDKCDLGGQVVDVEDPGDHVKDALVYWTLSLLRNLVWHRGCQAQRIRTELRSIKNLKWIRAAAIHIRTSVVNRQKDQDMSCMSSNSSSLGNIIQITLELVQAAFVECYDGDGRLMKTPPEVLDVLIDLLVLIANSISNSLDYVAVNVLAGLLALLAKVINNPENQSHLRSKHKEIDSVVQRILSWTLGLRDTKSYDESSLLVLLSSILRIYCCLVKAEDYLQQKIQRQLHMRIKSIGLCVILNAFSSESGDDRAESRSLAKSIDKFCVPILNILRYSSASSSLQGLSTLANLSDELSKLVRCNCLPIAI